MPLPVGGVRAPGGVTTIGRPGFRWTHCHTIELRRVSNAGGGQGRNAHRPRQPFQIFDPRSFAVNPQTHCLHSTESNSLNKTAGTVTQVEKLSHASRNYFFHPPFADSKPTYSPDSAPFARPPHIGLLALNQGEIYAPLAVPGFHTARSPESRENRSFLSGFSS